MLKFASPCLVISVLLGYKEGKKLSSFSARRAFDDFISHSVEIFLQGPKFVFTNVRQRNQFDEFFFFQFSNMRISLQWQTSDWSQTDCPISPLFSRRANSGKIREIGAKKLLENEVQKKATFFEGDDQKNTWKWFQEWSQSLSVMAEKISWKQGLQSLRVTYRKWI